MIIDPQVVLNRLQEELLRIIKDSNKDCYLVSYKCIPIWEKIIPSKYKQISNYSSFAQEAKENNALLMSDLTLDEVFFGNYQKYGSDNVDIVPFANIFHSERNTLFNFIANNQQPYKTGEFIDSEWIIENMLFPTRIPMKDLLNSNNPTNHPYWGLLVKFQQEAVLKYQALLKKNKHKKLIGQTIEFDRSPNSIYFR